MSVSTKTMSVDHRSKYYLEQLLLECSFDCSGDSREKCQKINDILNRAVKEELISGKYERQVLLPKELLAEIQ